LEQYMAAVFRFSIGEAHHGKIEVDGFDGICPF